MTERRPETTSGLGSAMFLDLSQRALDHDLTSMNARAGPEIDNVISAAHRLFVVFDDNERIPFLAQRGQGFEKANVIPRMKADRRLVENVKNAAQIRAELGRQPDSLRFTAAQGFGRATQRKVTQTDVLHEPEPL